MPADGPSINLCKVVHSAVALGYPMPTLLNWNGEFNRPDWHFAGSHIAKLESLLVALDTLYEKDSTADNDVALLVDAYDIWFQLPPSALLERFHKLNLEADTRVQNLWMDSGYDPQFPIAAPKQNIVITTAKDCQPGAESGSRPNYPHWPASPLSPDFYGEATDKIDYSADSARKYRRVRPRCVNSGMIMGKIGPLRAALRRCREKVATVSHKGRQLWSDQALIAEVIGEQEMWREWVRSVLPSVNKQALVRLHELSWEVQTVAKAALGGQRFEFGLGLDYTFSTMPPTCSAEEDGYFVKWAHREAVQKASEKAGVPGKVRVPDMPQYLGGSDSPLKGGGLTWADVPLYTDFFFGNAPVAIHHNAYISGLKAWRLENWWNMTWFYPYLRDLVTTQLQQQEHTRPLVRMTGGMAEQNEIVYWAPPEDTGRRTIKSFRWSDDGAETTPMDWEGICQNGQVKWERLIFGDEKGPASG
ncbi:uncharacterized protein LY79DRAFT_572617 [Colletotrichum navitas]|uniref:Uncharacterized protein n=1 Tax=Colletotrichum navitas TaxID=681940 RepID=A0AAD8PL11_9PEZI|nr:uncharacterized protein LY79DRAFT_572617 [Colletotrichum navitas]KAK1566155.1 hypothetical protein LY79DRAFT_572617 [Colletotrichum navitas]